MFPCKLVYKHNIERLTNSPIHNLNVERSQKQTATLQTDRIEKQLRIVKVQKKLRNEWQTQIAQTRYLSNPASARRRIDEEMREKLERKTRGVLRNFYQEKKQTLNLREDNQGLPLNACQTLTSPPANLKRIKAQQCESVPWVRDPDTSVSIVHDQQQIKFARARENQSILPYLNQLKAVTSNDDQFQKIHKKNESDVLTLTEKRIGVIARACARAGLPLEHEGRLTKLEMHASPLIGLPNHNSIGYSKVASSNSNFKSQLANINMSGQFGRNWVISPKSPSNQTNSSALNVERLEILDSKFSNDFENHNECENEVAEYDYPQPFEAMFDAPGAILHEATQEGQVEHFQEMARLERMRIAQMHEHASKLEDKVRRALSSFETRKQREKEKEEKKAAMEAERDARYAKRLADAITPVAYITPQSYIAKQQAALRKSRAARLNNQFGEVTKIRVPFRRSTSATAMPSSCHEHHITEVPSFSNEQLKDTIQFRDSEVYDDLVPSEILLSNLIAGPNYRAKL